MSAGLILSLAASRLGLSEGHLINLIRWRKLKAEKISGRWYVPLEEIERIESCRRQRARQGKQTLIHDADRARPEAWSGPELEILIAGLVHRLTYEQIGEQLQAAGFPRSGVGIEKLMRRAGLSRKKRSLRRPDAGKSL